MIDSRATESRIVGKGDHLGAFEQLVLLAILRADGESYGMSVRREIERTAARSASIGSVYATLERLEEKGLISSRRTESGPQGGPPRRLFRLERAGHSALRETREMLDRMWDGVAAEARSS